MQNQIAISTVDRRKVIRILIDHVSSTECEPNSPQEVTDEMIAEKIHPRQRLDIETLFGRPLYITEVDKIIDLRQYLEYVGAKPEKVVRAIGKEIRELTGASLM